MEVTCPTCQTRLQVPDGNPEAMLCGSCGQEIRLLPPGHSHAGTEPAPAPQPATETKIVIGQVQPIESKGGHRGGPTGVASFPNVGAKKTTSQTLEIKPFTTVCQFCSKQVTTTVHQKTGLMVYGACCGLAIVGCWLGCCLIPCCIDDLHDHDHTCPSCGSLIARQRHIK
mmetsp:Transcript_20500/g.50306  ORF Transcript_20500/g.50306 Transcript_20500/m.50306 type:complete len:170 (-) Transcript_20500:188-697(-)